MWTERQIEKWLEMETRELMSSEGKTVPCAMVRLMWSKFDALILCYGYSTPELISHALREVQRQRVTFDQALHWVVAYLAKRLLETND